MDNFERLKNTLAAGRVRRWHTDGALSQSVGEHTFGVMCVLVYLLSEAGGRESFASAADEAVLLAGALLHDAPERFTGDLPAPVRSRLEGCAEFDAIDREARAKVLSIEPTDAQRRIVFYADKLEAVLFAWRVGRGEVALYNSYEVRRALAADCTTSERLKECVRGFLARCGANDC